MEIFWEKPYEKLLEYLEKNSYKSPLIICDENTYQVCCKAVQKAIESGGIECKLVHFNSKDVTANEYAIGKVLFETNHNDIFIEVVSETISDITRYTAYKLKIPFILFSTAPSMDGFTSSVAALTIDNLKTTVSAKPPDAIFVDMDVINNAPLMLKKQVLVI